MGEAGGGMVQMASFFLLSLRISGAREGFGWGFCPLID